MNSKTIACTFAALSLLAGISTAAADDTIKLAVGQRGNWDTSMSEVGQLAGIFKKHGLVLETGHFEWLKPAGLGAAPDAHGERARERREARGERRIHRLF